MPFLPPNQQHQSTEGKINKQHEMKNKKLCYRKKSRRNVLSVKN